MPCLGLAQHKKGDKISNLREDVSSIYCNAFFIGASNAMSYA